MAQLLVVLLAASPILELCGKGGTSDPQGSGQGSSRSPVSILLSPIFSSRGSSIKIFRTTVKISDVRVVCLWR